MRGRRIFDPADAVVWTTAALLAILSGVGAGFLFWSVLAGLNAPPPLRAVVYVVGLVIGGVLPFRRTVQLRLFLALTALSLVVSFSLGPILWAPLVAR